MNRFWFYAGGVFQAVVLGIALAIALARFAAAAGGIAAFKYQGF